MKYNDLITQYMSEAKKKYGDVTCSKCGGDSHYDDSVSNGENKKGELLNQHWYKCEDCGNNDYELAVGNKITKEVPPYKGKKK